MLPEQNITWNKFGCVSTNADLKKYLTDREYGHGDYCHYTRLSVINSILENKQFWMSCVSKFNDKLDKGQFREEKLYYSLCFSTGTNENLALWYLYSGMNGQGGRLRFTKSSVRKLIQNASYSLWEGIRDEQKQLKLVKEIMPLEIDKDIQVRFKDIIYFKVNEPSKNVDLKYNTMTNHVMSKDEFDQYKANNIGFCKGLIWYYEKETRLLAKIIGEKANLVQNSDKEYVVILTFDEKIYKQIKLDFAPEVNNIGEATSTYKGIQSFIYATSHAELSEYHGTLKMKLCDKCDKAANNK